MLLSKYFLPVLKEQPAEAQIASHSIMLRSGMIRQVTAGIYSWLPFGLQALKNIENIVRSNMNAAGFIEMLMPCVQDGDLWRQSGRFDVYGKEMLCFKDRRNRDLLFGPTNEELITDIVRTSIKSYRDLPKVLYQIQWKFRDEIRPRFGVMRGREFLMKDAYSLDTDIDAAIKTYNIVFAAYMKTFEALSLKAIPLAASSGEIGGDLSHEFHVIADTGESIIYYDKRYDLINTTACIDELRAMYAVTEEKYDPSTCRLPAEQIIQKKGIEVGHIFYFADKYSLPMNALYNNKEGKLIPIHMGAYGIGISRLVAAIIEVHHDHKGIIWPIQIAPFKVAIINLAIKNECCQNICDTLYQELQNHNIATLYDDTSETTGTKFAVNDLIGTPWQIIVGTQKASLGLVEIKERKSGHSQEVSTDAILGIIQQSINDKGQIYATR